MTYEGGERMVDVRLSAEAWSYVRDALGTGHACLTTVDGYELRYGGTNLADAIAEIERQTA